MGFKAHVSVTMVESPDPCDDDKFYVYVYGRAGDGVSPQIGVNLTLELDIFATPHQRDQYIRQRIVQRLADNNSVHLGEEDIYIPFSGKNQA